MSFEIETFSVYPLGCNCSIIWDKETSECIIVDPGGDEIKIISLLKEKGLTPKFIIHTHAHFDHCLGTKTVSDQFDSCKIALHKDDLELYQNIPMQCKLFGVPFKGEIKELDFYLEDNQILTFGKDSKLEVIHTPGHSPGSVCFQLESREQMILFSGDTLFAGSIGRTDLWGGNYETIIKSIKNRIFTLDEETLVIPGHGSNSVIYNEKKYNPFFA
jgi:glyoxylase-like metal-dependent hydrolase (beta-lactamase superfamily II)